MRKTLLLPLFLVPAVAGAAPSTACAPCHREIYESYRRTPMANSSGRSRATIERFNQAVAAFPHAPSGFRYQVDAPEGDGGPTVRFSQVSSALSGVKAMPYFLGSGATARAYLLESDGFLFVSPVAWYGGSRQRWNLGPAYAGYGYPYLTRPAQPGCLNCHASFLNPVAGTQNRFATPPWGEDGIACERCHGDSGKHIAAGGQGAIVNPAKLAPDRRDSVCAQCHLTGEVRVLRPGADWRTYRPGDRLADSLTVFINRAAGSRRTVTSHVENLAHSQCQRTAGSRLWCGSCHNPHGQPASADRAAFYRAKCLACHDGASASRPFRRHGEDCVACHMPKGGVADAEHVVYTDHSIPRRPSPRTQPAVPVSVELVPFAAPSADPRDLALAYAIAAGRSPALRPRARQMLESSVRAHPDDPESLLYLAEIYRDGGLDSQAMPLYRQAGLLDPNQVTAGTGLGAIYFQRGDYADCVRLWQGVLQRNPGLVLVATNLAIAQQRLGDRAGALATLKRTVALSPGFKPAVELLTKLDDADRKLNQ